MPTIEELREFNADPLDGLEREIVRQILEINGVPGSALYVDSEERMDNLTANQCRIARSLLLAYAENDIKFDTAKAKGGSRGIDYDPQRDLNTYREEFRRMLYMSGGRSPDDGPPKPLGTLRQIPVVYQTGGTEYE